MGLFGTSNTGWACEEYDAFRAVLHVILNHVILNQEVKVSTEMVYK